MGAGNKWQFLDLTVEGDDTERPIRSLTLYVLVWTVREMRELPEIIEVKVTDKGDGYTVSRR